MGDIIDGWRMKSSLYWPQEHSNVLRRFLTAASRGTRIVYVTGNHDEFLRRYSDIVIGNFEIVDEATHVGAAGCTALVEDDHGTSRIVDWSHERPLAEVVPLPEPVPAIAGRERCRMLAP